MIKILQENDNSGNKILRTDCEKVKTKEFGSPELLEIIKKMKQAAVQDHDGVAVAAPQIGINKKIFVIDPERGYSVEAKWRPEVFINPEIVKTSNRVELKHEGCLSVRGIYGDTWRAVNVTVQAQDENGNKFSFAAGGITSHIIQHETDHLSGVLFIDHGINLEEDPNWKDHWKIK